MISRLLLVFAFSALGLSAQSVNFLRDIRPLLSDNCFACHGPDAASRMADVRLDEQEHAFSRASSGTLIVPNDSSASLVYQRISAQDPARRMPPAHSGKRLTATQIELVRQWIEAGAPWEESWALTAPSRPVEPAVAQSAWVRNPIDAFILSPIEAAGLQPAPEADKRTLIRRLALDLTGLPPTPSEVESFVRDKDPLAYEKRVDDYMARAAWGEHRARYWLDAARYADTHGLHIDNYREMWPYRDWVINAFNRNLSFDQFTIEQLAGDLLPNPTHDQLVATGFHRCNVTTSEGGVIEEEVEANYAKDRVDTTSTVWLGLTVGCAACHDHKFDPITQKDFYSLAAFFRNTTQKPLDGNVFDPGPVLTVRTSQDETLWTQLNEQEESLRGRLQSTRSAAQPAFTTWLNSVNREVATNTFKESETLSVDFARPVNLASSRSATLELGRRGRPAAWVGDEGVIELNDAPPVTADKPFTLSLSFFLPEDKFGGPLIGRTDPQDENRGWSLSIDDQRPLFVIIGDHGEKLGLLAEKTSSAAFNRGQWNHTGVVYDGSRTREGIQLYVNGIPVAGNTWGNGTRIVKGTLNNNAPLWIGALDKSYLEGLGISHLQVLNRTASEQEITLLAAEAALRSAGNKSAVELNLSEREALESYYLLYETPAFSELAGQLASVAAVKRDVQRRSSVTHVMEENPDSEPFAHILNRGMYDQPGERVEAAALSALPPMAASLPRNRLGLARWLMDDSNPLTARVTVNRFWQEIFGIGIVPTSEDFGSQGQPPSNPELLDWLAVEFRESGWDVKALFRLFVTSAAYRQSAAITPQKLQQDPQNILLSRGPRFRMDAEVIRDYALAASGLLVEQVGGPSVMPYQPAGVWEAVAMPQSNTRYYTADEGDSLHRRSLYTFWKRATPPPILEIMNAPTREQCTVRREKTNTPLQALLTMNAPDFLDAARHLASNAAATEQTFDARLDLMTAHVLARRLDDRERGIARAAYDDYFSHYAADSSDLSALLPGVASPQADLAALTLLGNQLLNLDEALNK